MPFDWMYSRSMPLLKNLGSALAITSAARVVLARLDFIQRRVVLVQHRIGQGCWRVRCWSVSADRRFPVFPGALVDMEATPRRKSVLHHAAAPR